MLLAAAYVCGLPYLPAASLHMHSASADLLRVHAGPSMCVAILLQSYWQSFMRLYQLMFHLTW